MTASEVLAWSSLLPAAPLDSVSFDSSKPPEVFWRLIDPAGPVAVSSLELPPPPTPPWPTIDGPGTLLLLSRLLVFLLKRRDSRRRRLRLRAFDVSCSRQLVLLLFCTFSSDESFFGAMFAATGCS